MSGEMQGIPQEAASVVTLAIHVDDPTYVGDLPNLPAEQNTHDKTDNLQADDDQWASDPTNPRNWTPFKKWITATLVSFYTFLAPLGSSMMAPGLPDIALRYHITNPTVLALTLCVFLLSLAVGPLFIAPLSEMYGRVWVLHIGNLVFLIFNLACALAPTAGAFIGFRFLAGFAGSTPLAIGGGVIGDLFAERDRASAMALYTIGPLIGPAIGPIIGGFVSQSIGTQYVFYLITGLCGLAAALAIPLLRETYAPVLRLRKVKHPIDVEEKAVIRTIAARVPENEWNYLWTNIARPMLILTRSFICFILSLYMALMYGIYYLMFATFPNLFSEVYHWSIGIGGLAYIGLGLGFMLSTISGAKISDKLYLRLVAKNNGKGKPEMRIPALIFGSFFVPVGLLWYGWSAQARIHWIMPIIGTSIYGFGLMTTFLPIQLYLVDAFVYRASAIAAASVFRSVLGFVFPLFGEQMFNALGYGWGNTLLAGLAIIIGIPFPIWIYYAGERIRSRSALFQQSF
ncbi:major facilitator superfamily domain-containing protein [Pisolithus croceorrhizus]|nr:major facilitator superfamily domain-containing protein [Pisolithus croceorrhizus]